MVELIIGLLLGWFGHKYKEPIIEKIKSFKKD